MNSIEIEKLTNDNIFDNKSDIDNFVSINIRKCELGETINALYLQGGIIHDVSIERKTSSYKKKEMLNPKDINVLHDPSNPRRNIIDRRDLEVVIVKFYIFKEDGGFYNELLHREDGPSLIYFSIDKGVTIEKYHILGQLHREDGPAIIRPNKKEWYINDKEISRFKYSMKFNRKYSHIDEINTLKEESKNRYKQFKEYKESLQHDDSHIVVPEIIDRYTELKEYRDRFDNHILNTIYDQHIIIQDHFNTNKNLDIKYLNQFDTYHTDILISLLKKIDEKIKYKKSNLNLKIKRLKSRLEYVKSNTRSFTKLSNGYSIINPPTYGSIIYLEVIKDLIQVGNLPIFDGMGASNLNIGDITWTNSYYEDMIGVMGKSIHIEGNKFSNNFDGSCFKIVGNYSPHSDISRTPVSITPLVKEEDSKGDIKGDIKKLKVEVKNLEYKYIGEIEEILLEYLKKLDNFSVDNERVDIEYEKMLLREVLKTDMLKI